MYVLEASTSNRLTYYLPPLVSASSLLFRVGPGDFKRRVRDTSRQHSHECIKRYPHCQLFPAAQTVSARYTSLERVVAFRSIQAPFSSDARLIGLPESHPATAPTAQNRLAIGAA